MKKQPFKWIALCLCLMTLAFFLAPSPASAAQTDFLLRWQSGTHVIEWTEYTGASYYMLHFQGNGYDIGYRNSDVHSIDVDRLLGAYGSGSYSLFAKAYNSNNKVIATTNVIDYRYVDPYDIFFEADIKVAPPAGGEHPVEDAAIKLNAGGLESFTVYWFGQDEDGAFTERLDRNDVFSPGFPYQLNLYFTTDENTFGTADGGFEVTVNDGSAYGSDVYAEIESRSGHRSYHVTALFTAGLPAPTDISAASTREGVKVTWKAVTGAQKYRVLRKYGKGNWMSCGLTTGTSFTDKTVESGKTYRYTVRCCDKTDNTSLGPYDTTGIKIKFVSAPGLPTLASKKSGMQVSWKAVPGAEMYRVYRKAEGETSWSRAGDTAELSLIDKTVESGKTYAYTIRCVSKDGKTNQSAYDTTGKSGTFIATPVLKSVTQTEDGVKVTWKEVAGAKKYRVYRKTASTSWEKLYDTKKLSYTDTTAQKGVTYWYTVRCITADGTRCTSWFDNTGLKITVK